MSSGSPEPRPRMLYENLDTSFVNLWDLLRFLSQRGFVGRVHVELKDYVADVFVNGASSPLVREVDLAEKTDTVERAGLHRLVLRARESSGTINVFEGADEATPSAVVEAAPVDAAPVEAAPVEAAPVDAAPAASETPAAISTAEDKTAEDKTVEDEQLVIETASEPAETPLSEAPTLLFLEEEPPVQSAATPNGVEMQPGDGINREEMAVISVALIKAIDRALAGVGADFEGLFRAARLELADDFTFLDPFGLNAATGRFEFGGNQVVVPEDLPPDDYVTGITEALRRVVETVATGDRARRVRERVALDLASLARKQERTLARSGFREQLDRIAGTRVI